MRKSLDAAREAERITGNTTRSAKEGDYFQRRQQQSFQKNLRGGLQDLILLKYFFLSNFHLNKITRVSSMSSSASHNAEPRASEEREE